MIAKHVPMRAGRGSDFARLVDYLTDAQKKNERVGIVSVSNCHSDRPDAAILEVLNTQAQNTRARSDKTYHLIISFRAGEQPDAATLKAAESRLCEALGFGAHRRISVVHHDTDHLHLHVAIDKIHPTRYTLHDPYQDYRTLAAQCQAIEREYGLAPDNHRAQKRRAENRADDMEHHAGIQSLLGWIRRQCLEAMQSAQSWPQLHAVMRENGLELLRHGPGLIISDTAGTVVKASAVARALSRSRLEARLGAFEAAPATLAAPARRYAAQPVALRAGNDELYGQYRAERQASGERPPRGRGKRALRDALEAIKAGYRQARERVLARERRQTWADWLRRQASEGNREALAALRARGNAHGLIGNTLVASGGVGNTAIAAQQDSVTKQGTIIYRVGAAAVRDDGDRLQVSRGATQEGVAAALRLAIARYGQRITVNGTGEFKEQVVRAAAAAALPVTFNDVELEQRRKSLVNASTKAPRAPGRSVRGRADERGRPPVSGSTVSPAAAAVNRYLAEREQERAHFSDQPRHRKSRNDETGAANFAGLRRVDGVALALLRRGDEIVVLAIDALTVQRLKRLAVGAPVTVSGGGKIATKERTRSR